MVAMPQEKLLPLLPALRDPAKIDQAVEQLLAAVQRKEAILTGYPSVITNDGSLGWAEASLDMEWPTHLHEPEWTIAQLTGMAKPKPEPRCNFEMRCIGVTLEVKHSVGPDVKTILLEAACARVAFRGTEAFDAEKTPAGKVIQIEQPRFSVAKTRSSIRIWSGDRVLFGVHRIPEPAGYMEVFVLQAEVMPLERSRQSEAVYSDPTR
jgi:hypothetical protein